MSNYVGTCRIVSDPNKTEYLFGDIKELIGRDLPVLERNRWGDCMCMAPDGLIDVLKDDVAEFRPANNPATTINLVMTTILRQAKEAGGE